MQLSIFARQLRLIETLAGSSYVSAEAICDKLGITRRTLFRYLDLFRTNGFLVERNRDGYRLSAASPFLLKVSERVHFSREEAEALLDVLDAKEQRSSELEHLRDKLARLTDRRLLDAVKVDERYAQVFRNLYEAIRQHEIVVIRNYRSLRSDTITDRTVEPYCFVDGNESVRCYEIPTDTNKTFRLSRMDAVEIVPLRWAHEAAHSTVYTDAFHFSGDRRYLVQLRLNLRAAQLLAEEFPASLPDLERESPEQWILSTQVCSYKGVGRFCLGLPGDVKPLGDEKFLQYLKEKAEDLTKQLSE